VRCGAPYKMLKILAGRVRCGAPYKMLKILATFLAEMLYYYFANKNHVTTQKTQEKKLL
jgi:uncharacterized membrane protein (DUF485 family)